jgi:choline dehydrogenase-like flavoprotein
MLDEQRAENSRCIRCSTCDGFPCLVQAKADAQLVAVKPARQHPNVTLLTDTYVKRIETSATGREAREVVRREGER